MIFTGKISHELVYDYLQRADVFISLYSASNLGNPLFEAMRCGKAIITVDTGTTGSVIKNEANGILLPEKSFPVCPKRYVVCCRTKMNGNVSVRGQSALLTRIFGRGTSASPRRSAR